MIFLTKEEKKNIETFIEKCKKYDESVEIKRVTVDEEEKKAIEEFRKQLRLAINIDDVTTAIRNDNAQTILNLIEKLQEENKQLKNAVAVANKLEKRIKEKFISKKKIEEWRKSKDKSLMWSNADDLYYFNKWTKELLESEE